MQTYDILNEIGANTAMVLDDTQMAYMNLRDYAKFSRIEESPEPKQDVSFDTSENSTRSSLAVKFKDEWDQGVKMKSKLTPKENQKPIINWRQDINKPDKSPKKLPSFQFNAANAGSQTGGASVASDACPVLPGDKMTIMAAHYNYMKEDGHKIEEVAKFYDEANDWAMEKGGHGRSALSSINTQKYADTLNKLAKEKNVDPLLMLAIFTVESGAIQGKDGGGIAQLSALKDKKTLTPEEDIGTAIDAIKGYLDKYSAGGNPMLAVTLFGAGAGDSKFLAKKSKENQLFDKDWISTLKMEFDDKDEIYAYWPRVVCSYIFFANSDTKKSVLAQGDAPSEYDFLFKDSDLDKVNFVKDYGGTNEGKGNSSMSQSITFQISKPDEVEVITSKIGAITKSGKDELGEYIRIKYDDNAEIEYHGLASVDKEIQKGANNPGQDSSSVKEKQVIGKAGKVITVIYYSNGKPEDPKIIWPSLRGKESNDKENGTLGAIVKQGQSDSQSVTSKDSVVVGGNTDGTYDMDDLANYDFSTSSDDSDSSSDSNNGTDSNNDNNNDAGKDFDPNDIPDMTLSGKSLKDIIAEANTITDEDEIKAVDKQKDKALEILKGTYEQSVSTLKENYEKEKKEIQDKKLDTDKEKEELKSAEEKYNKSLDEIEKTYKDMKSSINTYYSDKKTSLENKKKEEDNKKDNQGDKDNPEEKLDYDALNKEFEEFRSKRYSQWLTDNGLTSNSTYDFDDERYASEGLNDNKDFHQGVYCKQDKSLENYVDDMMKKIVKAKQQQLEEEKKKQEKNDKS